MRKFQDVYAHWRDSGRQPKFWLVDARASLFILLVLLHIRLWTVALMIIVFLFLALLEYYKLPLPVFLRLVRSSLMGKRKVIYL